MGRFKNANGVVLNIPAEKAARMGLKPFDDASEPESDGPSKSWKVGDLKEFAVSNGIDLGSATKKDDILAVITAAAENNEDDESDGDESDES